MIFQKDSGIKTRVIEAQRKHTRSSFQLIGTEAAIVAMTQPIIFEQPDSEFINEELYTGGWTKLVIDYIDQQLDTNNRAVSIDSGLVVRINKQVDEQVGVLWKG